jgi:RNA polymerase sporulation-specific sigma factor
LSLKKAVSKLKEREKQVIYSRYIVGKTQTELSEELNISQAQVSRIESQAIKTLKKLVK